MRRPRGDAGTATVLAAVSALILLTVLAVVLQLGAAVAARHGAQSAADASALAGALELWAGPAAACAQARELAEVNSARLLSCAQDGVDVRVTVAVSRRIGPFTAEVRARARAGLSAAWAPA